MLVTEVVVERMKTSLLDAENIGMAGTLIDDAGHCMVRSSMIKQV